jgi:hypothetical protein
VTRVAIHPDTKLLAAIPSQDGLLLQSVSTESLTLLKPATGTSQTFTLDEPYDRFLVQDEPPVVAAWFSANASGTDDSLFVNLGEIAFVDLSKKEKAIQKIVLKNYGDAFLGVDVAPRVPTGDGGRMFAFARGISYLSLVDAERPDFTPISIPLKAPDSDANILPGPLQFIVTNGHLAALFLAQGMTDLYTLDISVPDLAAGGTGVSVNVFPTTQGASSFTTYTRADGDTGIIVLAPSSRQVAVVHPATSAVTIYPLEGMSPNRLDIFTRVSPETGVEEEYAFIYDASGGAKSYYLVALHHLAEKKSKAFERFPLPAGVRAVYLLSDDEFLVMHSGGNAPMSLVTADSKGSVSSIGGNLTVSNEQFSADGKTLFALARKGTKSYVAAFDVATFQERVVEVSYGLPATRLSVLSDAGLVLAHDSNGMTLTVLPVDFTSGDQDAAVQFFLPALNGLDL